MMALSFDLLSFPFPAFPTKSIGPTCISFHCCWLLSPGAASGPQLLHSSHDLRSSGSCSSEAPPWLCLGNREELIKEGQFGERQPTAHPGAFPRLQPSKLQAGWPRGPVPCNKSILRDSLRGSELRTCQPYALWLCVLPWVGGRNAALVRLLSIALHRGAVGNDLAATQVFSLIMHYREHSLSLTTPTVPCVLSHLSKARCTE